MTELRWSLLKSERLKRTRGVSFEEILESKFVGIWNHPHRPLQQIMLFEFKGYIWVAPFIKRGDGIFLKTLYPSRKYTKRYKRGGLR